MPVSIRRLIFNRPVDRSSDGLAKIFPDRAAVPLTPAARRALKGGSLSATQLYSFGVLSDLSIHSKTQSRRR